ncbi:glycosyltransferase family 2 protein [Thermodesulfatator autotrophicus]|uniref:Glycosyltransferase 2-like domain-containing protein n=1 Tax=Thermodesulfatator autotrophicus TaxID=1795632 RepID=A0A177E520_9BACT|nr:glycosyltransferase family 2 protein [Thermodesulfatator autotrophicus]OAG27005.1 hypothetical protein TH606_09260 [Thermodesulfatator autotrophicus]
MDKVLISVIIPTYNNACYIKQAVDSVLSQSFRDFEIIVIDDGSTDNTKEVLFDYFRNGKIRYIYQENKGVSEARNRGIIEARGKYISFLDADDLYLRDTLKERINFLTQFNLKFIVTDFLLIESDEDLFRLKSLTPVLKKRGFLDHFKTDFDSDYILVDCRQFARVCLKYIPPRLTTILVEREFLIKNKIFFDRRLHRSEDLDFMWKIISFLEFDLVGILRKPTYIYMFNRASHQKNPRYTEKLIYYNNMISHISHIFPKKVIAERIYSDYWTIYKDGDLRSRLLLLKKFLFLYPFSFKYWKSLLSLLIKSFLLSKLNKKFR